MKRPIAGFGCVISRRVSSGAAEQFGNVCGPVARVQRARTGRRRAGRNGARVPGDDVPQVGRVVADVAGRHRHVVADLPLHAGVPGMHARRVEIGRRNEMNGPFGENGALASKVIGNGLVTPVPANGSSNGPMPGRVQAHLRAPRRRVGRVDEELAVDELAVHAVAGAHRHAAVAVRIPRDADARRDVQPFGVHARLAVREALIARVGESGRRLREHRAALAGAEPVEREVVDRAVLDAAAGTTAPTARRSSASCVGDSFHVSCAVEAEVLLLSCRACSAPTDEA